MVYVHYGVLLSHKNVQNLSTFDNTDGPRGYYTKRNKSEIKIPYEFIYMWNLKTKQKLTHGYREEYGRWRGNI